MIGWEPALDASDQEGGLPAYGAEPSASGRFARELPVLLVIAAVIAFVVRSLVAQAFYIPSPSMVPQLQINDRIVVSKIAYRLHEPRRGDVLVFEAPPAYQSFGGPKSKPNIVVRLIKGVGESVGMVQPSTEDFVKRVVGLPGETIDIRDGRVYVNGMLLEEPYLPDGTATVPLGSPDIRYPYKVPADSIWVMGDNRSQSSDSRVFGAIKRSSVVGRTVLRVWPAGNASFL